ncbi:MAG: two-component sensor histidine kinase [Microbacteriaceae bacterium]|nr:two-component sensor histidine kinase [Burkholderiaceae bacterium]
MRWLPASLQGRLLAGLLGAVVLVWLATAASTWVDVQHELDELLDGHLAQAAALLVVQQAREIDDDTPTTPLDAPQLHQYAPKVAFQVWHEGRLALRSANAPTRPMVALDPQARSPAAPARRPPARAHDRHAGDRLQQPFDRDPAAADFELGFHSVQIAGTAWRVFVAQGAERDVQVFVGEQQGSRDAILWAVLRGTLLPMALALPLLALAIWWMVRLGTAPLRTLGRTLTARHPQALAPVALAGAPNEMAPMLDALNRLFERITAMVEAERRFTADAAHELRTPIAAIRAQAQVALAETDGAARAHALRATLAGCDRANRLVEQMLTLSRLEAGAAPALASLDLSALARRVAAELAPRAIARQQTLSLDAELPHTVLGNDTLLAVLLRNLIDNALRYSPDGAELQLAVPASAGGVQLQVQDSGPGLAEADRQRLGERFFRVLGSDQAGSGLGWSIVRRIAAVHGATIAVDRSATLGGLAVSVRWPAAG